MKIKSVSIDNILYINFILFNISTLIFFLDLPGLKWGYVLYTHASYMSSNMVIIF